MLSPRSALRVIKSRGERLRLLSCLLLCAELLRNQLQLPAPFGPPLAVATDPNMTSRAPDYTVKLFQ